MAVSRKGTTGALALLLAAGLVAGCSGGKPMGEWLGLGSQGAKAQVFYAAVDDLAVYEAPSSSAKVLGRLRLHQKVTRSSVKKGYALVRTANGNLDGWVLNAKLEWKLPSAESPSPQAEVESAAPEPEAEPQPEPDAKPAAKPSGRSGASVFDPY